MSLASTGTFASLTSTLMMLGSPRCAAWWCWVGGGERCEGLAKRVGCGAWGGLRRRFSAGASSVCAYHVKRRAAVGVSEAGDGTAGPLLEQLRIVKSG